MGHSQAGKTDNHQRIVSIAARRFREGGVESLSVADLMQEAGLTHGGFYRHFDSREDLVAEAVACALEQSGQRTEDFIKGSHKSTFNALIDAYLGVAHRDNPGEGCAVTALAADAARGNERVRSAFTQQLRHYMDLIRTALEQDGHQADRQKVMLILSTLVGALSLARAVDDEQLSLEILRSAASALKE